MSVIKARAHHVIKVDHTVRLVDANRNTLYAYATFIGDSMDYVVNQLIETTIGKDREFLPWLAEHPEAAVYTPAPRRRALREQGGRP